MPDGETTVAQSILAVARRAPHDDEVQAALRDVIPAPVAVIAAQSARAFEWLSMMRGESFDGVAPLTVRDVAAYAERVAPLSSREVRWVFVQDGAFRDELMRVQYEQRKHKQQQRLAENTAEDSADE